MSKSYYIGHRKRLKEKFFKHPESLYDYEVVELLLGYVIKGKDVKPLAKAVLRELNGISNIFKINENINGIGKECVLFFRLVHELVKRVEKERLEQDTVIDSPDKVFEFLKFKIGFENVERIAIIFLNSKNGVIDVEISGSGSVNESYLPVREIVKKSLQKEAVSVILAHNHPSGNLKPSKSDIEFTKNVKEALNVISIRLLDHLIVSKDSYLSFKKEGLL